MAEQGEYNLPNLPEWAELETEIPKSDHTYCIPGTEWLPKTDWSRDGIIANDD